MKEGGEVNGKKKKIIEDISQAEAGLLRQTMLIRDIEGSKNLYEAQINTLIKSCRSKKKTALIPSASTASYTQTSIYGNRYLH